MTTIAANKDSIACDIQATHSGGYKFKLHTKIGQFYQPIIYPKPFYVGFSGDINSIPDITSYFMNIEDYKRPPNVRAECLVLTEDRKLFTFMNPSKWLQINEKFYAIGSGASFALGALEAGKSPLDAVKIAGKKDPNTGLGYKTYSFA